MAKKKWTFTQLNPSVYYHLGFAVARATSNSAGTGEEHFRACVKLLFEIANGRATTADTPEEAIAGLASAFKEIDWKIDTIRKALQETRNAERKAAAHLIEEWGWLDLDKAVRGE